MRELDLTECWELCIKMWKWVSKNHSPYGVESVEKAKEKWLKKNGFRREVNSSCFFCEYKSQQEEAFNIAFWCCDFCPGRLIDDKFSCGNDDYDYYQEPKKFYEKICELYKIYKSKLS